MITPGSIANDAPQNIVHARPTTYGVDRSRPSRPTASVTSEPVDRAAHAEWTTIEHVRVHHRRADVRVPEQLLHGPKCRTHPRVGASRMRAGSCVARHAS